MLLAAHLDTEPSAWVRRFSGLIQPGGAVLDVACGSGRHLRWLAARGFAVVGVDRNVEAVAPLQALGEIVVADIEGGAWPFKGRHFDAIVITNYLWRALAPALLGSLAEGGVLIHETFADGQQTIGKPSRPEFLLQPGELLHLYPGLRVVAFEDGFEAQPRRFVQRVAAMKTPTSGAAKIAHLSGTPDP
jgi:SAM-dependent methyltransferase